jgi:hypothetical protein
MSVYARIAVTIVTRPVGPTGDDAVIQSPGLSDLMRVNWSVGTVT